jgi:hypothetical protein
MRSSRTGSRRPGGGEGSAAAQGGSPPALVVVEPRRGELDGPAASEQLAATLRPRRCGPVCVRAVGQREQVAVLSAEHVHQSLVGSSGTPPASTAPPRPWLTRNRRCCAPTRPPCYWSDWSPTPRSAGGGPTRPPCWSSPPSRSRKAAKPGRVCRLLHPRRHTGHRQATGRRLRRRLSQAWIVRVAVMVRRPGVGMGMTRDGLERLTMVAASHVGDGMVPGLVALVAHGDEVHVEAIGTLAIGGRPVERASLFRIASDDEADHGGRDAGSGPGGPVRAG